MKNFRELDDLETFKEIVTKHHKTFVGEVGILDAIVTIDDAKLEVAHGLYLSNVQTFEVLLGGGDPDAFKRAASLMGALYKSKVIVGYELTKKTEDAETGWLLGYSAKDTTPALNTIRFYENYHNEAAALDLAFRCCDVYQDVNHSYDDDYAACMCTYLKGNSNLSIESFFMILKSAMM